MTDLMRQCLLRQGTTVATAWIEARWAKEGARVTVTDKGMDGLWTVEKVYSPPLPADALREKQAKDRNCFASIANLT